jgi:sugar (pentulose or hexulose) kinase
MSRAADAAATVAVFDIGKTNVKLSAATAAGEIIETVATANRSLPGPPYRHFEAAGLEGWLLDSLHGLAARHPIRAIVTTSHGSLAGLVDGDRLLMPMIDYEETVPDEIERRYRALAGDLEERGSAFLPGLGHLGRQLFFLECGWPQAVAAARFYLGGPQYWAWRLAGIAVGEFSYFGAESHVWDVRRQCLTGLVERRGWQRLLPPPSPAWRRLGPLRPELARRHGLPGDVAVLAGIHDSTASFYRYQQAGLADVAMISTGTWIVGLSDNGGRPFAVTEQRTRNADVAGRPLAGVLAMGGREFAVLAGAAASASGADPGTVAALVAAGTMALPSFAGHDGVFRGTAGRGTIIGPPPATARERRALALLYVALLTEACLAVVGGEATAVLDGTFVRDPLYPALVAALRPERTTLFSTDAYGTAAGAALLAGHADRDRPVAVDLRRPPPVDIPGLAGYATRWRRLAAAADYPESMRQA